MSRRFPPPWSVEETDACFILPELPEEIMDELEKRVEGRKLFERFLRQVNRRRGMARKQNAKTYTRARARVYDR